MSKFTNCYRCLQALLHININEEMEYNQFLKNYFEIGALDRADGRAPFDPRKSSQILKEFEHLLNPKEFNQIVKDFKSRVGKLIRDTLNTTDNNKQTPLHIASYFGDYKASRMMVDLGADSVNSNFTKRPLEVSKDKFSRSVL